MKKNIYISCLELILPRIMRKAANEFRMAIYRNPKEHANNRSHSVQMWK